MSYIDVSRVDEEDDHQGMGPEGIDDEGTQDYSNSAMN